MQQLWMWIRDRGLVEVGTACHPVALPCCSYNIFSHWCGRPDSVYIHIPFCRRRCNYCDFTIQVVGEDRQRQQEAATSYLPVLLEEMEATMALLRVTQVRVGLDALSTARVLGPLRRALPPTSRASSATGCVSSGIGEFLSPPSPQTTFFTAGEDEIHRIDQIDQIVPFYSSICSAKGSTVARGCVLHGSTALYNHFTDMCTQT